MKKKIATKAVTLATTGIVTATSVLNPVIASASEPVVDGSQSQLNTGEGDSLNPTEGSNVTKPGNSAGTTGSTEGEEPGGSGAVKPDSGNGGTTEGDNDGNEGGGTSGGDTSGGNISGGDNSGETVVDPVELTDLGVIGKLIGSIESLEGTVKYSKDAKVSVSATSLREDVTVSKASIVVNDTDTLIEFEGGIGEADLPTYSGELFIKYEMSDGTVLSQPLSEIIQDLNGVTEFVRDVDAPVFKNSIFSGKKHEVDGKWYYTENGEITVSFEDTGVGIDKDTWVVDGVETFSISEDGNSIVIPTATLEEGVTELTVKVSDKLGTQSQVYSESIDMYRETPLITVKEITGEYVTNNGISYIESGSEIGVSLSGHDAKRIKKVELLKGDNAVSEIKDGSFSLSEEGTYSIRITDVANQQSVVLLSELTAGELCEVKYDDDAPIVSELNSTCSVETSEKYGNVYTSDGEFSFAIEDTLSGLDNSTVKVENVPAQINNGKVTFSSEVLQEGETVIAYSASDNLGHQVKGSFTVYMMRVSGEVSGLGHSVVYATENGTFTNREIKCKVSKNNISSIESIKILKDNKEIGDLDSDEFVIEESGTYGLRVYDILGNKVDLMLSDLYSDIKIDTVTFDNDAPVLADSYTFDGETVTVDNKDYITKDGVISIEVSDALSGVKDNSAKVTDRKGKGIAFTQDGNIINIPTNQFADGSVEIVVSAKDNLDNTSENKTYSMFLHREFPEISGSTIGKFVLENGNAYFSKDVLGVFTGTDSYKVKKVELVKDGSVISNIEKGKFSIAESGSYSVKVTDLVGNVETYTLEELFGEEKVSSNMVLDVDMPEFSSKEFSGKHVIVGDTTYYTTNGDITVRFKDTGVGIDVNSFKVDGVNSKYVSITEEGDGIVINTEAFGDGKDSLVLYVSDKLGNKKSVPMDVYMHREFPVVVGGSHGSMYVADGKSYINTETSFELNGYDSYKVQKIELLKNGNVVSEVKDGSFTVSESGNYKIRVTDIINEYKDYSFSDLYGDCTSDVVLDTASPEFKSKFFDGDKITVEGVEYYTSNGELYVEFKDSASGIDTVSWKVEGVAREAYRISDDGKGVYINTEYLEDGESEISVSVSDMLGQKSTKVFNLFMHREFPVVNGLSHGELLVKGNTSYTTKSVDFKLSGYDSYKVKGIELFRNGEKVCNINNGEFSIEENGNYSIKVTDIINNSEEYLLGELFEDVASNVIFDNDAPEFKSLEFSGDKVEVDNVLYYTSDGLITVEFSDKLSGVDKNSWNVTGAGRYTVSEDGSSIVVDTKNLAEGNNGITLSVSDELGNLTDYKFSAFMHRYAPEINGKSHSGVVVEDGVAYSNKALTVQLNDTDNYKIKRIELIKDGTVINEIKNGSFSVSTSGEYTVRVVDLVNNSKVYKLEDLFNDLDSNVVVDTVSPTASITVNGKPLDTKNWITEEGKLVVDFSDEVGLRGATVEVNRKKFKHSYNLSKSEKIEIDLIKDVPRALDGKYYVNVSCVDMSNNTTELDTITVSADFDKPEFRDLLAKGTYVEDDGTVYFKDSILVTGSTSDVGSGVKSVELLNNDIVVGKTLPISIKDSGNYYLRVTDVAGLSTTVSLNSILGTTSNTLVADNTAPKLERLEGFKEDLSDGDKLWFSKYPELVFSITDTNIKSMSVKVNGEEKVSELAADGKYRISTDGYEGRVEVVVESVDKIGNTSNDRFVYYSDVSAPVNVQATVDKESIYKGGKMFFKEVPSVKVTATDNGVGLKEYQLSGSKEEVNGSGNFKLGDGSFFVEVRDRLGNTTEKTALNTLLGMEGNEFVVDGEAPEINVTKPESPYKNWYNKDITFNVNVTDNVGIDKANVYINGSKVDSRVVSSTTERSLSLVADTSKVELSSNGLYEVKVEVVDNAGNTSDWSDSIYIDRDAPTVDKFVFNGSGHMEGVNINGTDRYGFFFDGAASCDIYVSDGTVSSGIKKLVVKLEPSIGGATEQVVEVQNGVARVSISDNFKGFISAHAEDNVGNVGDVEKPDGIVTENSNWHNNSVELNLQLPETPYTDISGNQLYAKDVTANVGIGCSMSGIRTIEWGIGDGTLGTLNVSSDGTLSGDTGVVKTKDKNLVLSLDKALAMQGNANGLKLWARVVDRTNHSSEVSKIFSIDKDAPEITVSYDKTEEDTFYNTNRSATITVKERNFDPAQFKVDGTSGSMSNWTNNGDVWTSTMSFTEDKDYNFKLSCVDRAGNASNVYDSGAFTIDKTAPVMSVSWNTNKPSNGNYYNQRRTATITVVEHNFDASLFKLEGNGVLSGWSGSGDSHTATVSFDTDGEYEFSISGQDKAGNNAETFSSGKFNIDVTMPELSIEGVENSVSYKENVGFTVRMSDNNIDTSNTSVTLTARKQGNIRVNGIVNEKTGEFSFTDIPKEEVYDDIYTLVAKVTDKAGNVTEKSIKFSVNRFGSKYTFLDASILGTYLRKPKDIIITEDNVDKLDTEKARVSIIKDGVELNVDPKYITIEETGGENDKYSYKYIVSKEAFKEDGKYLVQIYSHAVEGTDYSSVSQEYAFVLDSQKPEIIVSGVESDGKYKDYQKNVTIDVRDKTGVKTIKLTLNGKEVPLSKSNGVYSFTIKESKEKQNFIVEVEDMAGNISTKTVDNFLISSDTMMFIVNQWWFKLGIGAVIVFLGAIIALIAKSHRERRKAEKATAEEYAEIYKTSGSSSESSSSKSPVEDLGVSEDAATEIMDEEDK